MHGQEHVWIIDDDKSIRWVLEKALAQEGIHTSTFDSGDSALNKLRNAQPDVVITDVRMPGTDGLGFLQP